MSARILVMPGDGIGPEIVGEAVRIIDALRQEGSLEATVEHAAIGGGAYDEFGDPLPPATVEAAQAADAILLGAVGGPAWDNLERRFRPEQGLLRLRAELGVFANLRPAVAYRQLAAASTLRPEVVADLDIMILRELTGGIYFGEPRGIRHVSAAGTAGESGAGNEREGFNTLVYRESEVERICRVGFEMAGARNGRLCSVDKANVLETSELWRDVASTLATEFPEVRLSHMYVDNAAMQLVRDPKQFDVIVTSNMFGDILSDLASMLTGSIGMLPSASVDASNKGLYEPIHGAAPDIAGQCVANPLATVLSLAMLLRHSLGEETLAERVERAVERVLDDGLRTADIQAPGCSLVGTTEMGDALLAAL